ncbi:MAG TPA: ribosome maturation factor RimP [Streptosporangiaceae bacterium]
MRGESRHVRSRPRPADRAEGSAETARLSRVLEPIVRSAGLDLESLKVAAAGRRRLLRVVVDADQRPSLDDIADLSRSLSKELDDLGVMGEAAYTLEVSSPGVDRPITETRHWRRAQGRLVRVPLARGAAGHPGTVEGRVITAGADGVILEIAGQQREYSYQELGPGQVQVEFSGGGAAHDDQPGDEGEPDGH